MAKTKRDLVKRKLAYIHRNLTNIGIHLDWLRSVIEPHHPEFLDYISLIGMHCWHADQVNESLARTIFQVEGDINWEGWEE